MALTAAGIDTQRLQWAKNLLAQMRIAFRMYRVWPGAEERTNNPAECYMGGIEVPDSVPPGAQIAEVANHDRYGFSPCGASNTQSGTP